MGEETHEDLLGGSYFICPFEGSLDGPFKDLFLYFGVPRDHEGDFALVLFSRPTHASDLLDMAHVNFMALDDCLAVTGIKGPPSETAMRVVLKFGRDLLRQDLYGMTQKSLGGTKPFNFLLGLVLEIGHAQGFERVRGFDCNRLPFISASSLAKRNFAGAYYGSGFRQVDGGVFEADVSSRGDVDKRFARIIGLDPTIRAQREPVFQEAMASLQRNCPFLFESPEAVTNGVQAARERLPVENS